MLCGALPTGAFRPGVVLNIVGTWEMILTALDRPVLTPEVGATGWWIDSHVARDRYAGIGCVVAGDMLEWFRKQFGFEEAQRAKTEGGLDWDCLMALARCSSAVGSDEASVKRISNTMAFAPSAVSCSIRRTCSERSQGNIIGWFNSACDFSSM